MMSNLPGKMCFEVLLDSCLWEGGLVRHHPCVWKLPALRHCQIKNATCSCCHSIKGNNKFRTPPFFLWEVQEAVNNRNKAGIRNTPNNGRRKLLSVLPAISHTALAFAWWETDKSWQRGWMFEVMDGSKLLLWKPNLHPEHICGPANKDEHVHLHFREHFLLSSVFPVCWSQSQCHVSEELQGFHFALVSISPSAEGASFSSTPLFFFAL